MGSINGSSVEKGTALIELAIVSTFLILLITACIDYSLALEEHSAMMYACRAGARSAAMPPCASSPVACATNTVNDYLEQFHLVPNNYIIEANAHHITLPNGGPAPVVQVTVTRNAVSR